MGRFIYKAVREPGTVVGGEMDGDDARSAVAALLRRGYHVLEITDGDEGGGRRLQMRFGLLRGMKRKDLVRFTRDMSTLLRAGLSLSQVLRRIQARSENGAGWGALAGGLCARLEDGQTLSEAMGSFPHVFDVFYVSMVRSGEEGGALPEVLGRLAGYGEHRQEMQSRVRMALVYPGVMFLMGCVTVGLLMTFVVPMFVHVFEESGQILPLPTRILVVISDFVSGWWWVIVPCGVGAGVGFVRFFQSASGRGFWSWLSLRMPILSPAFTKAEIALLANTLGALLGNGVSIIYALQTAGSIVRNTLFKRAVGEIALAVRDGAQLSRAVAAEALFPAMVADVIAVGETSGLLSESLLQLGEEYDHELERELKVLMTLLEPVMIIGVGAVVGFIVMAMILPVFQLGDTLQ